MLKQDHLTIESHLERLTEVQRWFRLTCNAVANEFPWIHDIFDQINLALAEGFTNAVRHAHADLPPETPIRIQVTVGPDQLELQIWDQGNPFDPNVLPEPKPGTLREGGYGWFLLRRLADDVQYERSSSQHNCLRIIKYPQRS